MAFGNVAFGNAYNAYKEINVKTASQGKLIVLLYDEAVKQISSALNCFSSDGKIAARDIEKFGNHIMKAQEIVSELEVSLDMEKGGKIAENLMSLYVFFNQELVSANIEKDKTKLDFVLNQLNQLRDAWESVASSSANAPANSVRPTLNITG